MNLNYPITSKLLGNNNANCIRDVITGYNSIVALWLKLKLDRKLVKLNARPVGPQLKIAPPHQKRIFSSAQQPKLEMGTEAGNWICDWVI